MSIDPIATTEPIAEIDDALDDDGLLDVKTIKADIVAGAQAYKKRNRNSADDYTNWRLVILGFRGLRDLAFANSHSNDMKSHAYRQSMSALLARNPEYDRIPKQTRSAIYQLMDNIEDISDWYMGLASNDRLEWKRPKTIVKHCPKHLIAGKGHNKPPKKRQPKMTAHEVERLRNLAIQCANELVPFKPERAQQLLKQLGSPDLPEDSP